MLGTIPGCGGTQRLTKAVGKSKAMEWCLTGEHFSAEVAEKAGLVSRVVPAADLLKEALKTADKIATMSKPIGQREVQPEQGERGETLRLRSACLSLSSSSLCSFLSVSVQLLS